jgi:hypothetical protein
VEEEEKLRTPLQSTSEKENTKKAGIKNVVGQTTMSLSNCSIKKNAGHHLCPLSHAHIQVRSVIKIVSTPFFTKKLNVPQKTHAIVKKNKLESIDLVLHY